MLRQMILATLLATAGLTCVVWFTQSLRFVDLIVHHGLSFASFVGLTLLLLPTFQAVIGPIALLVATLFVYNKMTSDHEITILGASGLSPARIARPAVALAVVMTALGYANSLYLMPSAFREFKDHQRLLGTELSHLFIREGVFNPIQDHATIFVRARAPGGDLLGIMVHDERDPKRPVTIMAERGAVVPAESGPRVVMLKGNRQEVDREDGRLSLLHFDRYVFDVALLKTVPASVTRKPRELFPGELFSPPERIEKAHGRQKLRMEGLHRLSSPLLFPCSAFAALGLLLTGGFSRRGRTSRIVLASVAAALVHVAVFGAKYLGERLPQAEALIYLVPLAFIAAFAVLLAPPGAPARGPGAAAGSGAGAR